MLIRIDDLQGPEIAALLSEHILEMKAISPPESKHALDLAGLRQPSITFWTAWQDKSLAACGTLKELDKRHGEIKAMRTAPSFRRKGVAAQLHSRNILLLKRTLFHDTDQDLSKGL